MRTPPNRITPAKVAGACRFMHSVLSRFRICRSGADRHFAEFYRYPVGERKRQVPPDQSLASVRHHLSTCPQPWRPAGADLVRTKEHHNPVRWPRAESLPSLAGLNFPPDAPFPPMNGWAMFGRPWRDCDVGRLVIMLSALAEAGAIGCFRVRNSP